MSSAQHEDHDESLFGQMEEMAGNRRFIIGAVLIASLFFLGRFVPYEPINRAAHSVSWLTEQSLGLAKDLFEDYGYLTVFLAPLLENTLFIGALIPSTIILLLAGLSIRDGIIHFWPAIPLAMLGAMIGDTISYGIGRFGWQRLGPESRLAKLSERLRGPMLENSSWVVLGYHFFGYSRVVGPAAAGFLRVPFRRWMMLDYIGTSIWATVYIVAGYLLGVAGLSLEDTEQNVEYFELFLFGLFVIGMIAIYRRAGRKQSEHDAPGETAVAPPDGRGQLATVPGSEDDAREPVG